LLIAVGTLVLTACGASTHHAEGRRIFAASCASCHTITGHDTQAPGGDLAVPRFTEAEIASFARVMPVHPRLSRANIQAVAAYVAAAQRR
jgi:mono/diheme cytochrome c family protein